VPCPNGVIWASGGEPILLMIQVDDSPIRYAVTTSWLGAARMQFDQLKRREFITLFGGAAAWPLSVRAQAPERMRRIGVLMNAGAGEPEVQARLPAFLQGLQAAGWEVGRNVRVDTRWSTGCGGTGRAPPRRRPGRCWRDHAGPGAGDPDHSDCLRAMRVSMRSRLPDFSVVVWLRERLTSLLGLKLSWVLR
jgi:hypothetical protein